VRLKEKGEFLIWPLFWVEPPINMDYPVDFRRPERMICHCSPFTVTERVKTVESLDKKVLDAGCLGGPVFICGRSRREGGFNL